MDYWWDARAREGGQTTTTQRIVKGLQQVVYVSQAELYRVVKVGAVEAADEEVVGGGRHGF